MKKTRIISKFWLSTLVVGMFGVVALSSNVLGADDAITQTNINNQVPAFTTHAVDGWTQTYVGSAQTDVRTESSSTYPTNEGTNVEWTATATDANNDNYYLIVCGGTGVTAANNGAPSCDTTQYCVSASTASGAQASCSMTTTGLASQTYNWNAYVCDYNSASLCSTLSNTSDKGTYAEAGTPGNAAGSPFHVNHMPSFDLSFIANDQEGSIAPGDTVRVQATNVADGDTGANTTFYVCSGEADQGGVTTAFDYYTNTCTGGTLLCYNDAGNYCDDDPTGAGLADVHTNIVSIPTAHAADYTVKLYMEDDHNYGTAVTSSDYTVIDVAPVLTSYSSDVEDAVDLEVDSYDTLTRYVTYTDNNGDRDVTGLSMVFFEDTAVGNTCTADENDCYKITGITPLTLGGTAPVAPTEGCYIVDDANIDHTLSAVGTGKTLTGSDNSIRVTCDFTIRFNATPTSNWETNAVATDNIGAETFADSSSNSVVNAISGIGVEELSIAYGTVAVGGDSSFGATTTTTMQNKGNTVIDVLLQGTAMCTDSPTCTEYTIAAAQQKWHHTAADFDWSTGGGNVLVGAAAAGGDAAGCLNRDMVVRSVYTPNRCENYTTVCTAATQAVDCSGIGNETCVMNAVDEALAWKIRIPAEQEAGSYSGVNTFASTSSSDCTGTGY